MRITTGLGLGFPGNVIFTKNRAKNHNYNCFSDSDTMDSLKPIDSFLALIYLCFGIKNIMELN